MFDRIVCINLLHRVDKRMEVLKQTAHWCLPQPDIFPAVNGCKIEIPDYFKQGGPAYGCLQSHLGVLNQAIEDKINTLFILEDDMLLCPNFNHKFTNFMSGVNKVHWDILFIGGQHYNNTPELVMPGVVKCKNTQRTHAYVVQGEFIKLLRDMWSEEVDGHCDWRLGPFAANFNCYAPVPFLIGQARMFSDILFKEVEERWWEIKQKKKHITAAEAELRYNALTKIKN